MSRVLIRKPVKDLGPCYEHYTDFGHGAALDDFMWLIVDGEMIVEERHYTTHGDIDVPSGIHYSDLFHGSYDSGRMIITLVPPHDPKWDTRQIPPSIVAMLSQTFPDAEELIHFS